MARLRSQHCVENHGAAERRTNQGGCALCRREWTRAKQVAKRVAVADYKVQRGCARCGYADHPAALHLHHRDPEAKEMAVSRVVKYGWARIWAEVAKCDVVCANCHAVHHAMSSAS